MTYAVSPQTGEVVANLFEDRDVNYFLPGTVTYLTRSDWNTFPETVTTLTATPEIQNLMENFQYEKPADAADISAYKFRQDNGISFIDMKDVPFDDPQWEDFIDQLTVGELAQITGDKMGIDKIESVSMPAYSGGDGPDGYQAGGVLYNAEMLCAGTFSKEMVRLRGDFFGEDSYHLGFRHTYAPGGNIHRTPYSGRNFEYYSEDALLSYIDSAIQTEAMAAKGCAGMFKHFCGNDQETNRHGVATFMNEQTYREVCLKGFEGGLSKGHSLGTMTAYNRIGCIPTASDYATMTQVLRKEWGSNCFVITDLNSPTAGLYDGNAIIAAGTSTMMNNGTFDADSGSYVNTTLSLSMFQSDPVLRVAMREAAHHILYAFVNSSAMNGQSANDRIEIITPWWQPALLSLQIVSGVAALLFGALYLISVNRKEDKKHA